MKIGDPIPSTELHESSPGNKINLANELSSQKKALIIGVPGAFSPACSASHVPGYISHPALKNAGKVFVIGVNDAFVMKSWGEGLDPEGKSGVRFLADPQGEFTRELDLLFDAGKIFGNERSKRYALVVEEGRVKGAYVEPDNTGVDGMLFFSFLRGRFGVWEG